jgi:hypothetical protein
MRHKTSFIEAVVTSVEGNQGRRYAVTRLKDSPSPDSILSKSATVTFSLSEWKSERDPVPGQLVFLGDIEQFSKGWRARSAKPVRA